MKIERFAVNVAKLQVLLRGGRSFQ